MGVSGPAGVVLVGAGFGWSTLNPHWPYAWRRTTFGVPAADPVGVDLHGVRIRHLVAGHESAAAHVVAQGAEPAGPQSRDAQVTTDEVILVVAVDRRLECGEYPRRGAVAPAAAAALDYARADGAGVDEDPERVPGEQVPGHRTGA